VILRHVAGRAGDLSQLALGAGLLRPLFRWLRAARPDLHARTRHEPFAARGEAFVSEVGWLEKGAFFAKMLGSDGNHDADPPEAATPGEGEELLFAGDLLFPGRLGDGTLTSALRARIGRATGLVVNLEGTVAESGHEIAPFLSRRGMAQLLAYQRDPVNRDWASRVDAPGLASVLGAARRCWVSVANNHTLDDGPGGFEHTVSALRALGAGVVGDARVDDGGVLVDVGRSRIGVFAMCYGSNQLAGSSRQLRFDDVPYGLSRERIARFVARLQRAGATHVVAILHWGYEHEHLPAPEQRHCAELLFDCGVVAIVGHHPHLLQPTEASPGRWVSYSIGDFVGGDRTIWSRFGALVSLRFEPDGGVRGELVPLVQSPFWRPQQTMLLEEAPGLERAVFDRFFRNKVPRRAA
jgi:hypothetical protein